MNRQVSVKFVAADVAGNAVTGQVKKNGAVIGATNTTFSHTFRPGRRRVGGEWEVVPPVVTVSVAGFPDLTVNCGFEV
jgi:hypothetical protein